VADSHAAGHPALQHHFQNMEQQKEASTLGMWLFLATEIMFFGALFTGYTVYRSQHPEFFAEASHRLDVPLGAANTAVLICSSLTMVLAVYAAQIGKRNLQVLFLILTIILGSAFLGVKAKEYSDKFKRNEIPGSSFHYEGKFENVPEARQFQQLFFCFYFTMTGVHALHMIIGIVLLIILTVRAYKGEFGPIYHAPLELTGLYWHFVDIIWIFLFPLLYLIGFHER
jgi:cytochrome c oxidase subunit 3